MSNLEEFNLGQAVDFRESKIPNVDEDSVFYLVNEVTSRDSKWFRHDVVLADSLQALEDAITSVQHDVFESSGASSRLVFLTSMLAQNEDLMDDSADQDILVEIQAMRASGNGAYAVFGIIGDTQLTLLDVRAGDAFKASKVAAQRVMEKLNESFVPVEVSLCDTSIDYAAIHSSFKRLGSMFFDSSSIYVN